MTPSRLRTIADKVEKLCIEGSRGARNIACPLCRGYAAELRDHAEEIAYGRRKLEGNGCKEVKEALAIGLHERGVQ